MTADKSQPQKPYYEETEPLWHDDQTINLRPYVEFLIRWYIEVLLSMLLFAFLAAVTITVLRSIQPDEYLATATIAIARVKSDIIFDERYQTQSDTGITTLQASANSRRAALLGLVKNGSVAQAVITELGDILDETEQTPSALLEAVETEIIRREDDRSESDLIAIHVTSDSPEKSTVIANAWAKYYVEQVNILYGQVPPEVLDSVITEMQNAQVEYEAKQGELESFVANNDVKRLNRLIMEKQGIIDSLQLGKQTAIDALVEEETNAQRQVISAYLNALAQNRLLAFNKEQEAKRQLLGTYIDAEQENRLLAIEKDREARTTLFDVFTSAQITSTIGVLTSQVDGDLAALTSLHTQRNRLQQLLASAQALETQIAAGGDPASQTSVVALAVLKSQAFATIDEENKLTLQFNLDSTTDNAISQTDLQADVAALSNALTTQIESLQTEISRTGERLANGDYLLVDELTAQNLAVSAPLSQTQTLLTDEADEQYSTLTQATIDRYMELFELGGLTQISAQLSEDSPLPEEVLRIYPELFTLGELSQQVAEISQENPLIDASEEQAQALLQLQGLGDVSGYTDSATGINTAIEQLEIEIQALEANLESESARQRQLVQQRDLGWDTFVTLSNKVTELRLERNATDSEVRLAVPAIVPTVPLPSIELGRNVALAGVAGLILGLLVAFFSHLMGYEPFFARRRTSATA